MTFARDPDVEVEIYLLPYSEGGRQSPAFNGYRSQHQIRTDYQTTGTHQYEQREQLEPGERSRGTITFITPEVYPNSLRAGDVIDILEDSRLVGRATILRVLNRSLERTG